ncbi:MAG TPA: AAA family ATPase [Candidatus Limnocylindrales bacterium]
MSPMPGRPAVAILLPPAERTHVVEELRKAGYDPLTVADSKELGDLLTTRRDVIVGVVDVEADAEDANRAWELLHGSRVIPALLVVNPATLDRLDDESGHETDEYLTRPYTAESIRWRVEAMVIRSTSHGQAGATELVTDFEGGDWGRRGQLVAVFNPKGGVGKTMIAVNLAAALVARGKRVLIVDADTVTGHIPTSLGMDGVPTVVDHWRDELDGGPVLSFDEQASAHSSGLKVLPLSSSPIHTEVLDPERVAQGLTQTRRAADVVIVDLHPSYSPLNRSVFDTADRIIVPVTPDLAAIRAVIKLVEVADELGVRDRLSLVVNRAASGVAVSDLERTIGLPVFGQIRSGGMLVVRTLNEGRPLVEIAPREKITQEFLTLADAVMGIEPVAEPAKSGLRLFGRPIAVRA